MRKFEHCTEAELLLLNSVFIAYADSGAWERYQQASDLHVQIVKEISARARVENRFKDNERIEI